MTVKGLTSSDSGYTFEVLTPSLPPQAPTELRFRIVGPDGVLRSYRDRHDRPLHLIFVSRDLGVFRHAHPSLGAEGCDGVSPAHVLNRELIAEEES